MIGPIPANRASHLEAFLLKEPTHHLLPLGLLALHGTAPFLACVQNDRLAGIAFVGREGLVVPAGVSDPESAYELGEALRSRNVKLVVGEATAVGHILRALDAPRMRGQPGRLCTATPDDMGPYVTPALRPATREDEPELLEVGASYYNELCLLPPPEGEERQVRSRLAARCIWVIKQDGKVAFRVDIAAKSTHGAHVDIIYTVPAYRGRGLATTGLGQIARSTLARLPRLSALAPEPSPAAAALVRKVGFGPALPWRSIDLRKANEQEKAESAA